MRSNNSKYTSQLLAAWKTMPGRFIRGMSDAELQEIEGRFGFAFPPDLAACLRQALPVGINFPHWRRGAVKFHGRVAALAEVIDWPISSMLFDVENNRFWHPRFGPRPRTIKRRESVVRAAMQTVPKLIPVCGHRYLPTSPAESGNPVLSVYQTDVIYYGENLLRYVAQEFGTRRCQIDTTRIRRIDFWSDLVERNV